MADPTAVGTPDSNAGGKSKEREQQQQQQQQQQRISISKTKDRACPFCNQQFTSSSLGRHLDLYIKEKNPKPADGFHNVDEIRKIRGHITRRQPRNSVSKRESSTPATTTPATRSPSTATGFVRKPSPPNPRDAAKTPDALNYSGTVHTRINQASWEATGVINDIPSLPRIDYAPAAQWDAGAEDDPSRNPADGKRVPNKQTLVKATFDQKQKMLEAMDDARAAELALHEVLGSIRAANDRQKPSLDGPFDYDPLTLDFPALCLNCLPPTPTLYQTSPIPSPNSWAIEPPDHMQYESLRAHFQQEFHRWRLALLVSDRPECGESATANDYRATVSQHQTQAHAQEEALSAHLNAAFSHWSNLTPPTRIAHWRLELARAVGRKATALAQLKQTNVRLAQENAHLRGQVDQLSRLQSPREFRISQPHTYHISDDGIAGLNEISMSGGGIGFEDVSQKKQDIGTIATKAIARWKAVVQSSRGMPGQKKLDHNPVPQAAHGLTPVQSIADEECGGPRDADMDVDSGAYHSMAIGPNGAGAARAPEAPMGLTERPPRYASTGMNGAGKGRGGGAGGSCGGGASLVLEPILMTKRPDVDGSGKKASPFEYETRSGE